MCGDSLLYATDAASCWQALREHTLRYPDVLERTARLWERLKDEYTFEARASQLVAELRELSPRVGVPRRFARHAQPTWLQEMTGTLLQRRRDPVAARELEIFHVHPTPAGVDYLSSHSGLSYLSGGFGPGPWHISLSERAEQLPEQRFDAILLEQVAFLDTLTEETRNDVIAALLRRVKATGMLGVVADERKPEWASLFAALRLTIVAEGAGWVIAAR